MDKVKRKVLVVGEQGVGKSTLIQTYTSNGQQLQKDYLMTLVADIASKIIEVGDDDYELFFYDFSGREILRSAVSSLTSDAQMAIFVYDITNSASFTALDNWVEVVKKGNGNRLPQSIVISTKNDFSAMKTVTDEQAQAFAKKIDAKLFHVNSLTYQQVEEAIDSLLPAKS